MENITETVTDRERKRVDVLSAYDLLDTPPEAAFDRFTALAAGLLNMPVAFISFVDADRVWLKSCFGIKGITQLDPEPGLCVSAVQANGFYVVEDTLKDPRTMDHSLVCGAPGLRFYAAAPLKTKDGYALGALCVMDKKPHQRTAAQEETLLVLAAVLMDYIELRNTAKKAEMRQKELYHVAAHDLRNPLTIISLEAELMRADPGISAEISEMCDQIRHAGEKMSRIIDDLLRKSKEA